MNNKLYVFAGNFQQAKDFARGRINKLADLVYIDRPNKLRGLRGITVYKAGTWYTHPEASSIEDMLKERQAEVIDG